MEDFSKSYLPNVSMLEKVQVILSHQHTPRIFSVQTLPLKGSKVLCVILMIFISQVEIGRTMKTLKDLLQILVKHRVRVKVKYFRCLHNPFYIVWAKMVYILPEKWITESRRYIPKGISELGCLLDLIIINLTILLYLLNDILRTVVPWKWKYGYDKTSKL